MPVTESRHRYLPISERDRLWGLHVHCGGYVKVPAGAPYPSPDHPDSHSFGFERGRLLDEYQFHLITRGSGVFECEGTNPRRIDAGTVFLLFPGVWHRYRPDPHTGWDEYWFGFDGEQAQRMMSEPFFSVQQPVIPVGQETHLLKHLTDISSIIHEDVPGAQRILAGLAMVVLGSVQQRSVYGSDPQAEMDNALQQTKRLISERVAQPIDGKILAQEVGVGYHWLRRVFRKHTGFSLHQYHLQLRLSQAMELLEGTDRDIQEIARDLGFDDPYYFSRMFRKHMGQSPSSWRNQRRGRR